jgi:hypothetical protein
VHVQPLPHWVLLFFLGGIFLHFLLAGGRTFYSSYREGEPAAWIAKITFIICGTATVWFLGLHRQIRLPNGLAAAVLLLASLVLYEWARHTIWGRRFGLGWGTHVPDALCEAVPANPPSHLSRVHARVPGGVRGAATLADRRHVRRRHRAVHACGAQRRGGDRDQRDRTDYAAYRDRAGKFWPKLSRARPGRSTP